MGALREDDDMNVALPAMLDMPYQHHHFGVIVFGLLFAFAGFSARNQVMRRSSTTDWYNRNPQEIALSDLRTLHRLDRLGGLADTGRFGRLERNRPISLQRAFSLI